MTPAATTRAGVEPSGNAWACGVPPRWPAVTIGRNGRPRLLNRLNLLTAAFGFAIDPPRPRPGRRRS